jgi:hypothetical protein
MSLFHVGVTPPKPPNWSGGNNRRETIEDLLLVNYLALADLSYRKIRVFRKQSNEFVLHFAAGNRMILFVMITDHLD